MNHRRQAAAVAVAALVTAAGCSSSSSGKGGGGNAGGGGSGGSSGGAKQSITVGVLADVTGPAASGNKTAVEGVKAGVVYAARNGVNVKYVVADTATNPATALSAAQKLVTQDRVDVVIAHSAITFAAANYLTSKRVPVVGPAEDGPEWTKATNMFSVFGALHQTKVSDTLGKFFKAQGVTTVGAVGYSISPLSSESAKAAVESAKSQGIKQGYLNASFPFGSTDVQPVALAMKAAGVDGFTASVDPNTSFALVTALRQAGADIKVAVFPTGYGGDLLQAGPGALNAAQNVFFSLNYEPVEMQTAATKAFVADLKAVGITGSPTYAEYNGYLSVGLITRAVNAAKSSSSAAVLTALSNVHDWDALGLFGGRKLDINDRENIIGGVGNCLWVTKLKGNTFELVKDATPICGEEVKGVTVAPST